MSFLKMIFPISYRTDILLLSISCTAVAAGFFHVSFYTPSFRINPAWAAVCLCGIPIAKEALSELFLHRHVTADLLVTIALAASLILNEITAAGEIACIMQLGALLENMTVSHARSGMERLVQMKPSAARIVVKGQENIISADDVSAGDVLRVCPGETIPADGRIIKGHTSVDQALLTGESLPVDKGPCDEVASGTINQFGSFSMTVTKAGKDSSLQKMIRLLQSADAGKARIVQTADRWAAWIVPAALFLACFTWGMTGDILRAVTILVVFCPCALVLATPTAMMAGIGNASRHGILIKEGDALERLSQIRRITFDKTGTLTYGKPQTVNITNFTAHMTDAELFSLAASAELHSEHPLGKSLLARYQSLFHHLPCPPEQFTMFPGLGVTAEVRHHTIVNGNQKLMKKMGISISDAIQNSAEQWISTGCTVMYISIDHAAAGFFAFRDTLRSDMDDMIRQIKAFHICPILLTGDHHEAASYTAQQAGISEYQSECLPEDKLKVIDCYEKACQPVCMIGDGINDAPALKRAHVGIAMGGAGSDLSAGAADMVLIRDDIAGLPHLISLSRKVMSTIRYNLTFSMGLNVFASALAMYGLLDPIWGALVHNTGSVMVILNSARLFHWQ